MNSMLQMPEKSSEVSRTPKQREVQLFISYFIQDARTKYLRLQKKLLTFYCCLPHAIEKQKGKGWI